VVVLDNVEEVAWHQRVIAKAAWLCKPGLFQPEGLQSFLRTEALVLRRPFARFVAEP
jgi:hypothetical protein